MRSKREGASIVLEALALLGQEEQTRRREREVSPEREVSTDFELIKTDLPHLFFDLALPLAGGQVRREHFAPSRLQLF